jgi:hypothetical protein
MANKTDINPQFWFNRLETARKVQKDYADRYGFDRIEKEYKGEYEDVLRGFFGDDVKIIPINEVKAFCKTLIPSVYSRDPIINVNPQGIKSIGPAKIAEKAVNAYWRELKIKRQVKKCILDAIIGPWGWIKVGYSAEIGEHVQDENSEVKYEVNEYIRSEEIFAIRESWRNIFYDPMAVDAPYDCRWMAHRIYKPVEAIKEVYNNADNVQSSKMEVLKSEDPRKNESIEMGEIYEIWDKDTDMVYTVAEGCDKYLSKKEWPYAFKTFPFIGLTFDVNPNENYPQSQIGAWEPQLWEKIKIRSMQLDHIKRFGRQLIMEANCMSIEDKDKFCKGVTGSILEVKKGTRIPPTPIQYPTIQTDMYMVAQSIDQDKDNISGQSNIVRGAKPSTNTRTLGEIQRVMGASDARNSDPLDLVEEFSENVADKLIKLMKQFISIPKFVRITQKEAQEIQQFLTPGSNQGNGFTYTSNDIQGEFETDIRAGSTLPLDRKNRVNLMIDLIKLGPSLGIMPNGKVSNLLGKNIMNDFEIYEVEEAYEQAIEEIKAQQDAQMQMAQMQAQAVAHGIPISSPDKKKPVGRPPQKGIPNAM